MSIYTEGAINRLTAAVLALAVTVEESQRNNQSQMREPSTLVRHRFHHMLDDVVMVHSDHDDRED